MRYLVRFQTGTYYRVIDADSDDPRQGRENATRFADFADAERAAGDWNDYFAVKGRFDQALVEQEGAQ